MKIRKKFIFTLCSLFLTTGAIVVGVLAASSVGFRFRCRSSFSIASNDVDVSVSLSATNAGNPVSIPNSSFDIKGGATNNRDLTINESFAGTGDSNAIIYTIQIVNNSDKNTLVSVSDNLANGNVTATYNYTIGGTAIDDPSNLIIYKNEIMVITATYIATASSGNLSLNLDVGLSTTDNSRQAPFEYNEGGLELITMPKRVYEIGELVTTSDFSVRRTDNGNDVTNMVQISVDSMNSGSYDNFNGFQAPGRYRISLIDFSNYAWIEYYINVKAPIDSITIDGENITDLSNAISLNHSSDYGFEKYKDLTNYNNNISFKAVFDSSQYHCYAIVSYGGLSVSFENLGCDYLYLTSDEMQTYYYPKELIKERGFVVYFVLVDLYFDDTQFDDARDFYDIDYIYKVPFVIKEKSVIQSISKTVLGQTETDVGEGVTRVQYGVTSISYSMQSNETFMSYATSGFIADYQLQSHRAANFYSKGNVLANREIEFSDGSMSTQLIVSVSLQLATGYTYQTLASTDYMLNNQQNMDIGKDYYMYFNIYDSNNNLVEMYYLNIGLTNYNSDDSYLSLSTEDASALDGNPQYVHSKFEDHNRIWMDNQYYYSYMNGLVSSTLYNLDGTQATLVGLSSGPQVTYYKLVSSFTFGPMTYNLTQDFCIVISDYLGGISQLSLNYNINYTGHSHSGSQGLSKIYTQLITQDPASNYGFSGTEYNMVQQLMSSLSVDTNRPFSYYNASCESVTLSPGDYTVSLTPESSNNNKGYVKATVRLTSDGSVIAEYFVLNVFEYKEDDNTRTTANVIWNESVLKYPNGGQFVYNSMNNIYEFNQTIRLPEGGFFPIMLYGHDDCLRVTLDSSSEEYVEIFFGEYLLDSGVSDNYTLKFSVTSGNGQVTKTYTIPVNIVSGNGLPECSITNGAANVYADSFTILEEEPPFLASNLDPGGVLSCKVLFETDDLPSLASYLTGGTINFKLDLTNSVYIEQFMFNNTLYTNGSIIQIPVALQNETTYCGQLCGYARFGTVGAAGSWGRIIINIEIGEGTGGGEVEGDPKITLTSGSFSTTIGVAIDYSDGINLTFTCADALYFDTHDMDQEEFAEGADMMGITGYETVSNFHMIQGTFWVSGMSEGSINITMDDETVPMPCYNITFDLYDDMGFIVLDYISAMMGVPDATFDEVEEGTTIQAVAMNEDDMNVSGLIFYMQVDELDQAWMLMLVFLA